MYQIRWKRLLLVKGESVFCVVISPFFGGSTIMYKIIELENDDFRLFFI